MRDHKATLLHSGGIEDHAHLLIKVHPQFAIASTVQLLKSNSSRWINENDKTPFEIRWQSGYGASSVNQSMADTFKRYISTQRERHQTSSFRDEYLAILKKHRIDFDPRYVFDEEIMR
ncbi:MAG: transposase [Planctomycetaceae bacterium]|nr:transposase [Planctomycetaceae bacterium]